MKAREYKIEVLNQARDRYPDFFVSTHVKIRSEKPHSSGAKFRPQRRHSEINPDFADSGPL